MSRRARNPMSMTRRRLIAEDTAVLERPVGQEATEAAMAAGSINDLPDSAFAYIEPGGTKDDDGKTVPRSLRHFPIHDAAHVRNALARASQSPFGTKALPKIRAAAKKLGIGAPAAGQGEALGDGTQHQGIPVEETPTIVKTASTKPGRLLIQLIKAGWSGNGRYYSEAVLKRDGPTTFPAGTLSFVDHDTDEQAMERPSGTLTRLASVMTKPAYYDPARKALMGEVRVFAPWREAVLDWAESGAIGMSIRAYAEGEDGKAPDGKEGWIVSALTEGRSVDYVTKPAAGGAIVAVLESIGAPQKVEEARNIGAWLESRLHLALTQLGDDMYGSGRLSREERIVLSSAMGDALKAWTGRVEADAPALFQRDLYDEPGSTERPTSEVQETAPAETPAGEPAEPPAETPAEQPPEVVEPPAESPTEPTEPAPETPPPTPDPPETPGEPTTQPGTEAEPAVTEEVVQPDNPGAQTPTTPGSARQVIEAEVAQMRRKMALMEARETARRLLATALSDGWIPPATIARITESLMDRLPLAGDQLDEAELTKMAGRELARAEQEIAEAMQAAGVGRPRDLGTGDAYGSGHPGLGGAEVERRLEEAFLGLGNSDKVAKTAARGRD